MWRLAKSLQFAMRVTDKFPSMAIQMVAIGEDSGALDAMLQIKWQRIMKMKSIMQ